MEVIDSDRSTDRSSRRNGLADRQARAPTRQGEGMRFGLTQLALDGEIPSLSAQIAREVANNLIGSARSVDGRWRITGASKVCLTDGVRDLYFWFRHAKGRHGARVVVTGASFFVDGIQPDAAQITVGVERGPEILAREIKRRLLPRLDAAIACARYAPRQAS
jgi:hypothetical protein